jgi:outer membrane lipoprotein-sorting protein
MVARVLNMNITRRFYSLLAVFLLIFSLWTSAARAETVSSLDATQSAAIAIANDYLNSFTHLQGDFIQVAPDGQLSEGSFFFRRPLRAHFNYNEPKRLIVIADGFWIGIVNNRMKTTDRYPIGSTPYWALLKDKVDLSTDMRILAIERDAEHILVSIEDQTGQAAGTLTLIFKKSNQATSNLGDNTFQLFQWLVTDAQGLTTSVEVKNLVTGHQARNDLFTLRQYDR